MKRKTHEGQDLQQWSRLMQNGQQFESTVANGSTVHVTECPCYREAYSAYNLYEHKRGK